MKTIRIKSLRLLNFCGVREASYQFAPEGVTTFSAANGKGKSTIANAITYVLFGTNTKGATFEVKTYDADGTIIPEIPHEAELTLTVDGNDITFRRTLTDTWKGDSVRNTYKYYVDGEVTSAGDYQKTVESVCPSDVFRLTTSVVNFLSEPWTAQRSILESLVPDPEMKHADDADNADRRYDFVIDALRRKSFNKLMSQLRNRRREVQAQLDMIPARLAELDKSLPEKQDWESVHTRLADFQAELNKVSDQLQQAATGNADAVRTKSLRDKLDFAYKRCSEMEKSARIMADDDDVRHQSDVINARTAVRSSQTAFTDMQSQMNELTEKEVHAKNEIHSIERAVGVLNESLQETDALEWAWDDKLGVCPHCGQTLPMKDIARIKEESLSRFNESKARKLKELQDEFTRHQHRYTELNSLLSDMDGERRVTTNRIVKAKQALQEAEATLSSVMSDVPETAEQRLAANPSYKQVKDEIVSLEHRLIQPSDDAEDEEIKLLSNRKQLLERDIHDLIAAEATEKNYLHIQSLIEGVRQEKAAFQAQLDDINGRIDTALEYYEQTCHALEDSVNALFSFVRFSMFQRNLDGEAKPYCECFHGGVPYSSLNSADRVNAGIDIAYAIARHYDVSTPILIDECESVNEPIYTGGQQIRFRVTTDPEIKVSYED